MTVLRPFSLRPLLLWSLSLALTVALTDSGRSAQAQTTKPVTPTPTAKEKAKKTEKAKEKEKEAEPIDLNSATTEELMTLPGVGEATARKIIDSRPHKTVEDLAAHGVPARRIEEIKPLATVRPIPTAIDLNSAPLLQIETLPGVGPTLAKEVIAARPFTGYEDLAKVKGFGPAKIDSLKGRVKFGKGEAAARTKTEKAAEKEEKAERAAEKEERAEKTAKARMEREEKAEPKTAKTSKVAKEAGLPGNKVNLNTATLEELDALPGIGQVYAQEIVKNRPYAKIEDIMKLKGIKEVEFGKIKDRITVDK